MLPYKQFLKLQAALEDYADLKALREAKEAEASAPAISLNELKTALAKPSARRGRQSQR